MGFIDDIQGTTVEFMKEDASSLDSGSYLEVLGGQSAGARGAMALSPAS